jgi:hypothetical protein
MLCKNCKTSLNDDINFCYNCGAKVIRNKLTFKHVFEDFNEQFLNLDNKFLQTFIALFITPEAVIGGYINGTRKKYINAINYFAIAITFSGLQVFVLRHFFPDAIDISDFTSEDNIGLSMKIMKLTQEYNSFVMMLLLPAYALMGKIVFLKNKTFNYTELLVVFMYTISQMAITGVIIILTSATLGFTMGNVVFIFLPLQILYSAYCLKRLYALNLKKIILKTLLFLIVFSVFYLLAIIVFMLILIFVYYGGIHEFKEAMEQMQKASITYL